MSAGTGSSGIARTWLGVGLAAVLLLGTPTVAAAAPGASAAVTSNRGVKAAAGGFTAAVDFATLEFESVRGNKCQFTVKGTLNFTGTLVGPATGTTTAIIFAPCSAATTTPPGTYFDTFRFEGQFAGTVNGSPATGELTYAGVTRAGGAIDALITLRADEARAVLRADAQVTVGGTYTGVATAR